MNQSKLIIILLIIVLLLLILQILLSSKKPTEAFQNNKTIKVSDDLKKNMNSSDLSSTYDFVEYSKNSEKLLDMFKSLEDAEKKCSELEDFQYQKEERTNMRENDRTFKELQEQDKKINELKEIVKYLTIEKKRRDKINGRCRNNNQRKLNKQYDIVRKLNSEGLVKDNSINLDLNLSESGLLQNLTNNLAKNLKNKNDNKNDNNNKCITKGQDFINVDSGKIGKCSGCDVEKLKAQEPYILKDFS
jgi:hypothetical protein